MNDSNVHNNNNYVHPHFEQLQSLYVPRLYFCVDCSRLAWYTAAGQLHQTISPPPYSHEDSIISLFDVYFSAPNGASTEDISIDSTPSTGGGSISTTANARYNTDINSTASTPMATDGIASTRDSSSIGVIIGGAAGGIVVLLLVGVAIIVLCVMVAKIPSKKQHGIQSMELKNAIYEGSACVRACVCVCVTIESC